MDVVGEEWLTTGQAAKIASRDIRTVRRWIDEGRLKARVSPGGHRQVALTSLLNLQQPARSRRRRPRRGTAIADPVSAIGEWADITLDWDLWSPPPGLTRQQIANLVEHIDEVTRCLEELRNTATEHLDASAPERSSDFDDWLNSLPVPNQHSKAVGSTAQTHSPT